MNIWFLMLIIFMLIAATLLMLDAADVKKSMKVHARFEQLLQVDRGNQSFTNILMRTLDRLRFTYVSQEFRKLLAQAGWDTKLAISLFLLFGRVIPILGALLLYLSMTALSYDNTQKLMAATFVFSMFFVGTNMLVRWRSVKAVKQIKKELVPFLHMLRMLFNSGLSVEHALLVLVDDSGDLFPCLKTHLRRVIQNVKGGQDQADALMQMAKSLDIQEISDTVAMLYQVSNYGGNIQASLNQYIALVEERQLSEMREYVTKLSAKMSIVMIVFMFPALIIFIAGPGFLGLVDALGGAR